MSVFQDVQIYKFKDLIERYPNLWVSINTIKQNIPDNALNKSKISFYEFNELYYNINMFNNLIQSINQIIPSKSKPVYEFSNLYIKQLKIYDFNTYRGKKQLEIHENDLMGILVIAFLYSCNYQNCPFVLIKSENEHYYKLIFNWNIYSKTKERKTPIIKYL